MKIRNDAVLVWSLVQELCSESYIDAVAYMGNNIYKSCMQIDCPPFGNSGALQIEVSVVPRRYNPDFPDQSDPHREDQYLIEWYLLRGKGKPMLSGDRRLERAEAKEYIINKMKGNE